MNNSIKTKQYRGSGFMTISKFSNNGNLIYIGDKESKIITAVETNNFSVIGTFNGHNGVIWSLDTTTDDKKMISCSGDMSIIIWNSDDGSIIKQILEQGIPKNVSIQKNTSTNYAVVLCESISKRFKSYINVYDIDKIGFDDDHELIQHLEWENKSKPTIVLWLDCSNYLVGTEDGSIYIIDINNKENIKEYKFHNMAIKSIVFNKSRTNILTASLDSTTKLINLENWEVIKTIESKVPINYAIFNHNDRKIILAGGLEAVMVAKTTNSDLNIKFYRTSDMKLITQMSSHFGPVRYLDKSPNGKMFVSASQDGTAKIYNLDEELKENNLEKEKISYKLFGDALTINSNDLQLIDETNNLEYVNIKQKIVTDKPQPKRIVGMPPVKDNSNNNENFKINYDNDIFDFEKRIIDDNCTIRVNNLPPDIDHRTLFYYFNEYGIIEEKGIKIKSYSDNTMAFIKYCYIDDAKKAIEKLNRKAIDHYIMNVEFAKPM